MKLALLKEVDDGRGEFKKVVLEYDLYVYKQRLQTIAYEYYIGRKHEIEFVSMNRFKKYIFDKFFRKDIDDNEIKDIIIRSFDYSLTTIEKELRKQSVNIL